MSNTNKVRRQVSIPRLTGDALDWVERSLAIGMGYDYRAVANAFVTTFPYFLEDTGISEERAMKILEDRFKRMCRDKRRSSYHRIKERHKRILELCEDPSIAYSIRLIIELEKLRQMPVNVDQLLKIHHVAHKIEDSLENVFQNSRRAALSLAEA